MNIIKRISRLFIADMHGLLDTLEDPETQLKQAIREMETHLQNAHTKLETISAAQTNLERQKQFTQQQLGDMQQQLELCIAERNDELAKSILRKKLHHQLQLKTLEQQLQVLTEDQSQLQTRTEEQQNQLQMIKDKLELFSPSQPQPASEETGSTTNFNQDDIEVALLFEKQRYQQNQTEQEQNHE